MRRRRFLAFGLVGIVGFVAQLTSFVVLASIARWPLLVTTAVSVVVAVLHNFGWHEHWTWADRTRGHRGWPMRLLAFVGTNGVASLAGNVAFVAIYSLALHAPRLVAMPLAVITTAALNFLVADRLVFGGRR